MKLDRFDILGIAAAGALLAAAVVFGITGSGDASRDIRSGSTPARIHAEPPKAFYAKLAEAESELDAGQVKESITALNSLVNDNPVQSDPHALLGQAYARLQDYPQAMKEFRIALSMDADYIDSKSPKFIGKRIKAAVKEGMDQARAKLKKDPADPGANAAIKDGYYVERMLAGGCE